MIAIGVLISVGIITTSKQETVYRVFDIAVQRLIGHPDRVQRFKRNLVYYNVSLFENTDLHHQHAEDVHNRDDYEKTNKSYSEIKMVGKTKYKHTKRNNKSHTKKKTCKSSPSYIEVDVYEHSLSKNMFQFASLLGIANLTGRTPLLSHKVNLRQFFNLKAVPDYSCVTKQVHFRRAVLNTTESQSLNIDRINLICQNTNMHVTGPLRSWKYFNHVQTELRHHFQISDVLRLDASSSIAKYLETKQLKVPVTVSVYMGRGPYHNIVIKTTQFIKNAMRYFLERYDDVHFIFLCTDTMKCKKFLLRNDISKHSTIHKLSSSNQVSTLSIMAATNHVIIGVVESLSWWGAWINSGLTVYDQSHAEVFEIKESELSKNLIHGPSYFLPHWISV